MKKFKKSMVFLTVIAIIASFFLTGATYAADAPAAPQQQPQVNVGQLLKGLISEYKETFFRHRITSIILKNKEIQAEIVKKLAATPEADFGTTEIAVVRDYLRTITTLKNVDPNSYLGEKMPLLVKGLYSRVNSGYQEKLEDLTEKITTLVVVSMLKNDTAAIDEVVKLLKRQNGTAAAAFASLTDQIVSAMKFQMNSNASLSNSYMKETMKTLEGFKSAFGKSSLADFDAKNGEKLKKMNHKRLWKMISAYILIEVADLPSEIERIGKMDINKISQADLLKIPGVSEDAAKKIMDYKAEKGVITSVQELDAIKGIGPKMIRKLKTGLYSGDFVVPEKEWTVLCFINGDNNLELASLMGINVMERVGSTANMNVVVQIDRIARGEFGSADEAEGGDTAADGNWSTCRRYFVQKDSRPFELNSILLEKMGEVDMGSNKNFVEFVKYGITHFPAKHYVVLISNHGSEFGIGGISFDDQSQNHMNTIQVGQALSEIRDMIKAQNGNDLLDLMVFDCCLLAKIEMVKEISEYAEALYACENVQINWYGYDDFLRFLDKKPESKGTDLARAYHKAYVDFMRNWARQKGQTDKMVLTSTAFDLTKYKNFDNAFVKFSQAINAYADAKPEIVNQVLAAMKPVNDVSVFDLIDFVKKVQAAAKDDKNLQNSCREVLEAYGKPINKVNTKEFNIATYPESSFILNEAHNYLEETGNGLSIGIFTKPTWITIGKLKPEWGLDESNVMNFLNKFKDGNYNDLKLSQESEWDDFMIKMINKN